jgi:hypothetical protein
MKLTRYGINYCNVMSFGPMHESHSCIYGLLIATLSDTTVVLVQRGYHAIFLTKVASAPEPIGRVSDMITLQLSTSTRSLFDLSTRNHGCMIYSSDLIICSPATRTVMHAGPKLDSLLVFRSLRVSGPSPIQPSHPNPLDCKTNEITKPACWCSIGCTRIGKERSYEHSSAVFLFCYLSEKYTLH